MLQCNARFRMSWWAVAINITRRIDLARYHHHLSIIIDVTVVIMIIISTFISEVKICHLSRSQR